MAGTDPEIGDVNLDAAARRMYSVSRILDAKLARPTTAPMTITGARSA
jgi:hypothetical protein